MKVRRRGLWGVLSAVLTCLLMNSETKPIKTRNFVLRFFFINICITAAVCSYSLVSSIYRKMRLGNIREVFLIKGEFV